jgi:hypothetical protein
MQLPNMLLLDRLLKPATVFRDRLTMITKETQNAAPGSASLQGLFVLAISSFETMLADNYQYFIRNVPGAFDFKSVPLQKDSLLDAATPAELIEEQVERHVVALSYERFTVFFGKVTKALGISQPDFGTDLLDRIIEAKETKNLLLHNNLRVNSIYIEKAGPAARAREAGGTLSLTRDYVDARLHDLGTLASEVMDRLRQTYANYTRLRALRELWSYLFTSPVMKFDDYWEVDEAAGRVVAIRKSAYEQHLAHSEQMFLAVLRHHFTGAPQNGPPIMMYSLDTKRRNDMLYLLGLLHYIGP